MAKVLSTSSPTFVKGGSGKMFGKTGTGTQKPGTTATASRSGGGGKWAKGGGGKMTGKKVTPAKPL